MKKKKTEKGLSFMLVFGSYGCFAFEASKEEIRLALGVISFRILFYDMENVMSNMIGEEYDSRGLSNK